MSAAVAPIDREDREKQFSGVSKEPKKVEEPSTPYVAKASATKTSAPKSTADEVKRADDAAFQKAMDKVFETHKELFRKLAQ